jgi:GNAT superfamily N-acetyltransferase
MNLRAASEHDAPGLLEVHLRSYEDAYRDFVPSELLRERLDQHRRVEWTERLKEERLQGGDILLVESHSEVVGFCQYGPSSDGDDDPLEVGSVRRLFVLPTSQRQGVGTRLIQSACSALLRSGRVEATLWVLGADTLRARPFYESAGWHPDSAIRPFERDFGPEWSGLLTSLRYRYRFGQN